MMRVVRKPMLGDASGRHVHGVVQAAWLVALVGGAATASPHRPAVATRRANASDASAVRPRPRVAVVAVEAPPPPPPPVIDAEQRAILDALETVVAALATTGTPREVAFALGGSATEVELGRLEAASPHPALTRVDIGRSSAASVAANVTTRTPISVRVLGTRFGDFEEFEYLHEFDASLPMVACRVLSGGDEIVLMIILDGHPADPGAAPVTAVEITRRAGANSYCASR